MADLAAINVRIRTLGAQDAEQAFERVDRAGTRTAARADQAAAKVTQTFSRMRNAAAGLDAVQRRTTLLAEGLQFVGTRAQSLVRLQAAETQLQTAISRGNLNLEQRIRLERELQRVQTALATQRVPAPMAAPVGIGGRASAALGGVATTVRGAVAGFAGGLVAGAVITTLTTAIQRLSSAISGTFAASDELETALRKLKATSRLTGVDLKSLESQALKARDAFALSETQAVDLTAATVRMAQRAGDASRSGALLTAWLDLAAANGQSADEALQGLNTTLIGQDEGLNRLGLANPQQIYEKWAKAAGTTAARMNDAQKATAIVNEVIQTGTKVVGEYANSLDTAAGAQIRMLQEGRALQAQVGGLFENFRKGHAEVMTEELRQARDALDLTTTTAQRLRDALRETGAEFNRLTIGQAIGRFIAEFRRSGFERQFRDVIGGASTTATPPEVVDPEDAFRTLVRSLELGTATIAMRREATQALREHLAAARDESRTLDDRNQHAEKAKLLQDALATDTKAATDAIRERTAALITLIELEGPQVGRWGMLLERSRALQASLDKGNLSLAERVKALGELAAIEAATFPATLPLDRLEPRVPDIRRPDAGTLPLDLNDPTLRPVVIPGGEGSIFGRLAKQIQQDGATALDAVESVKEQLKAAAESLAMTFEAAIVGAFAAIGAGGNIGEAITSVLGSMLGALGEMAIQFGLKSIAIAKLMQTIMNALASLGPVGAIAAGAALVALGAALKGAASSSFGGVTGGQTFAPITRTVTVSQGASVPLPTNVPQTANAGPTQTFNFTVIGQNDPVAQRQIASMVRSATQRGA